MAQNAMSWRSSHMIGGRRDELPAAQMCERHVDGAFREPCCLGDRPHTGTDVMPFASCGLGVNIEIHYERSRLLIVPDQIAHQNIENVIVDGNRAFKTRISM